jgi:hypothetical protein
MSKRSERREAERAARKLAQLLRTNSSSEPTACGVACQQSGQQPPAAMQIVTAPETTEADLLARAQAFFERPVAESTPSQAQIDANRMNAQHSTGPVTAAGKAASSRNRTVHGLTAEVSGSPFTVLPGEDQALYNANLAGYKAEWKPTTATELDLVQRLCTHAWLRDRAQRLQDNRLALGLNTPQDYKQFEVLGRYYATHLRAYNKAFADLVRLKRFQMSQKKDEALLERRAQDAQIRFESQKRKAEEHAAKMETIRLKQEAQKQRNERVKVTQTSVNQSAPAAGH